MIVLVCVALGLVGGAISYGIVKKKGYPISRLPWQWSKGSWTENRWNDKTKP